MDSTVRNEVAGATVGSKENTAKSGAGFGKVVMFGTVPGIMLGAAGITAAASAVSDDFDAVVEDFKEAASDLLGTNEASATQQSETVITENYAAEAETEVVTEIEVEAEEIAEVVTAVETEVVTKTVVETEVVETASVVETLPVAQVSDEMSFGAAFEAARSQVGSEGVFEWRGNYYSTYTKEEWDAMDADARGEYMQKYYDTDMNAETEIEAEPEVEYGAEPEVVEEVDVQEIAENMTVQQDCVVTETHSTVMTVETEDVEVEFVVEESVSSDVLFGVTDGHETMFIDDDGDGVADYMVVDANDDGEAGMDEIHYVGDDEIMMGNIG
jgi:hypothetical protein